MYKLLFIYLLSGALFGAEAADDAQIDWSNHYHQKMYDYYNEQLGQEAFQLIEADGAAYMTGNWNGARDYLEKRGVLFSASYVTDMVGNPVGGKARGFAYAGSLGVGLGLNFEEIAGWKGFTLFGSTVWRTGTSLSRKKIDNQFPVQQVFGSQTVKLNELYFQQTFWERNIRFKAGRLDAGNDFLASPLYAEFVNNGFNGNPISIFNNFPAFSAYPNSTWGAYLSIKPIPQLLARFAVYNANTEIFLNSYHGVNFTFESTNGVIWMTEWVARINLEKDDRGMPGHYKVGFFYQTGNAQDFERGNVHGDYCYYFLFDQMIYRPNGPKTSVGLTPFISLLFTPKGKNLFPSFFNTGLVYKGPFASRPKDSANIGFIWGQYSSELANIQRQSKSQGLLGPFGNRPQSYEAILELNYWFQINNWFTITPDLQYIFNPKGFGTTPNAFVIGTQIGIVI